MIVKGGQRAKGRELAAHLLRADTNEAVSTLGCLGVVSRDVKGALVEMEAVASGSRSSKPLYHVSVSPEADERLTAAQWERTADALGEALGLDGHQRLVVLHTKHGRQHAHIVWNRVDAETLKTAHHSHNYRTHEEVARALEREFGLKRTQGIHAEREGEKPRRARPKTRDSQQASRTGWRKEDAQRVIAAAWSHADSGKAFRAELDEHGYVLARGDRRDFVVLDPAGGLHAIRSAVKGLRAAKVRQRLADLRPEDLPSVAEARAQLRANPHPTPTAIPTPNPPSPLPTAPSIAPRRLDPQHYAKLNALLAALEEVRAKLPQAAPKPRHAPPQPVPTPPSWARDLPSVRPPTRPNARPEVPPRAPPPKPPTPERPVVAPPGPSQAAQRVELHRLGARQAHVWAQTTAEIDRRHGEADAKLTAHHARRLIEIAGSVDGRLAELNGLLSRAGALFDRRAHDREIAYLVAVRQRSLAEEKARQDTVRAELKAAQALERQEAQARHDRHTALQRQVLLDRHARQAAAGPKPSRKPDELER